jgi:hypothetical protein
MFYFRKVGTMTDRHSEQHKAVLDDLLLNIPGVIGKKWFGCPGYFIAGKAFACVFEDSVVIKLPKDLAAETLKRSDVKPFAPGGSAMGGWIQITRNDSTDYREEMDLMTTSIEYVADQAASAPPKKTKGKNR